MARPPLPKDLRRDVAVFTAFRKAEAKKIDAVVRDNKLGSRAEVVRECVLSVLENRAASWEQQK